MMSVKVRDKDLDGAIRRFRQENARNGGLSKVKDRERNGYKKPGVKRRDKKKEGIKNSRKKNRERNKDR
ncbi:MAG: 30S ribosomal protein S21 [bacterium]|nr:30S ribosomal protein S21 [bacterium]